MEGAISLFHKYNSPGDCHVTWRHAIPSRSRFFQTTNRDSSPFLPSSLPFIPCTHPEISLRTQCRYSSVRQPHPNSVQKLRVPGSHQQQIQAITQSHLPKKHDVTPRYSRTMRSQDESTVVQIDRVDALPSRVNTAHCPCHFHIKTVCEGVVRHGATDQRFPQKCGVSKEMDVFLSIYIHQL